MLIKSTTKFALLVSVFLFTIKLNAQNGFPIPNNSAQTIDFTGFTGAGFAASPTAGQLDSDHWDVNGFSDAKTDLTTGDYARGSSTGGTGTGGVYAFDISNGGASNPALGVQPIGSDFTPGNFTLTITNTSGSTVTQLAISYKIYVRNDQDRSNSFNFSHSSDNSSYTSEASLDYTSTAAKVGSPTWETITRSITLTSLNIPNNTNYYLRWTGNDAGGSGSRDEFALDDISITASAGTPITFSPSSGIEGKFITVTGAGFNSSNTTKVTFGTTEAAFTVKSATEITTRVPAGATLGPQKIKVTTSGVEQISSADFTIDKQTNGCEPNDLFFSEYIEASNDNEKGLEIYNGTGQSINLNNYKIERYTNGSATVSSTFNLPSHVLTNGSTYKVIHQTKAGFTGDITSAVCNFSGNDPVVLVKISTDAVIDAIGQVGNATDFANDVILKRNADKFKGDTDKSDAFDKFTEWTEVSSPTSFASFGSHTHTNFTPPSITTQPGSQCADASGGQTATITFSLASTGTSYKWKKWNGSAWIDIDANTDGVNVHSGFNTASLTVKVTEAGDGARYDDQYYCEVSNANDCSTNSSVISIRDQSDCNTTPVLPVTLVSFKGIATNQTAVLTWKTSSETNNEGFVIEKSIDQIHFEDIGFVKGHRTTKLVNTYQFTDQQLYQDAFYRLRQVDINGDAHHHSIISVKKTAPSTFKIYPNPIITNRNCKIDLPSGNYQLLIHDLNGKIHVNKQVSLQKARQTIFKLKTGTYLATFHNAHLTFTQRIIIRRR